MYDKQVNTLTIIVMIVLFGIQGISFAEITNREILDNVLNAQNIPPYAMSVETHALQFTNDNKTQEYNNEKQIFKDKDRFDKAGTLEFTFVASDPAGSNIVPDHSDSNSVTAKIRGIWKDNNYVMRRSIIFGQPSSLLVQMTSNERYSPENQLVDMSTGGFLRGFISIELGKSVPEIIANSDGFVITKVSLNSIPCYLIQTTEGNSEYKIWVDPAKSFAMRKIEVHHENTSPENELAMSEIQANVEIAEFEKIQDHYMPVAGKMSRIEKAQNGNVYRYELTTTISDIIFNPDFDKMGAFVMDEIPEGTRVWNLDSPQTNYLWQGGKPIIDDTPNTCPIHKDIPER